MQLNMKFQLEFPKEEIQISNTQKEMQDDLQT